MLGYILTALSLLAVRYDYHVTVRRRRDEPTAWQQLTAPLTAWYLRRVTTPRHITGQVHSAMAEATAEAVGVVQAGSLDTIDKLAAELRRLREQHKRDIQALRDEIGKVRDERREAIKGLEEQIAVLRDELRRTAADIEVGTRGCGRPSTTSPRWASRSPCGRSRSRTSGC